MKKDKLFWKVIALALVVVLYLFALNGRYAFVENNIVADKWKQEVIRYSAGWNKWTKWGQHQ